MWDKILVDWSIREQIIAESQLSWDLNLPCFMEMVFVRESKPSREKGGSKMKNAKWIVAESIIPIYFDLSLLIGNWQEKWGIIERLQICLLINFIRYYDYMRIEARSRETQGSEFAPPCDALYAQTSLSRKSIENPFPYPSADRSRVALWREWFCSR